MSKSAKSMAAPGTQVVGSGKTSIRTTQANTFGNKRGAKRKAPARGGRGR